MSLLYKCDNCGTIYKSEEYINLPAIFVRDDMSIEKFEIFSRKCIHCGEIITV